MTQVAIIGMGKMGTALLRGLLEAKYSPADIIVVTRDSDQGKKYERDFAVQAGTFSMAVQQADIVVLAIKPQQLTKVLEQLPSEVWPAHPPILVSMLAGVALDFFATRIPKNVNVIRVMPNLALQVAAALTIISPSSSTTQSQVTMVEDLFSAVGDTIVLPEKDLIIGGALSGSGPAYVFLLVEAMVDAGIKLGLTKPVATYLAQQTVRGAGKLLQELDLTATDLRHNVTSPGGTTAAGLLELEKHNFRYAISAAIEKTVEKSNMIANQII